MGKGNDMEWDAGRSEFSKGVRGHGTGTGSDERFHPAPSTEAEDGCEWRFLHSSPGRFDPMTGLYSFGNRDFSPAQGRWPSQDPLSYVEGEHRFEHPQSTGIDTAPE
jgi:RHS repeat-associated protein